jgi:EpsI family protein
MTGRILTLSVVFLATTALLARAVKTEPVPVREPFDRLPMHIGSWTGQEQPEMDARVLQILGVDDYVDRIYRGSGASYVGLYVGYYRSQREGDTMHSPLNCLPGAGWNPVQRGMIDISIAGAKSSESGELGRSIRVNRIIIQKGTSKQLVLYWYQSHGRVVASEYWAKIYTVLDAIRTNRTDAALVRIICPIGGIDGEAVNDAEAEAVAFIRLLFPLLERHLPE